MVAPVARPRVSVVIPTRDRPELLRRALGSVLAQTFRDLEAIVVDDGSRSDLTPSRDGLDDPRVHWLRHDESRGAPAARNAGIRIARGEYVAFLDDDDEWMPDKLALQVALLDAAPAEVGVVYSGIEQVSNSTGEVLRSTLPTPRRQGPVEFLRSTRFGTSVPLCRRACFDEAGLFDESLPGMQDRDMWIRIARTRQFRFVPEVLVRHHVHEGRITADLGAKIAARETMLEKYRADLERHPRLLARHLRRLGLMHYAAGRRGEGRRNLWRAFRTRPAWLKPGLELLRAFVTPRGFERHLRDRVFPVSEDGASYF